MIHRDMPPDSLAGVPIAVHRLSNELSRRGHSVDVFTTSRRAAGALYSSRGISAVNTSGFRAKLDFCRKIKSKDFTNYDIVHVHSAGCEKDFGVPLVRTFYGSALYEALYSKNPARFFSQLYFVLLEIRGVFKADICTSLPSSCSGFPAFGSEKIHVGCLRPESAGRKSHAPLFVSIGSLRGRKRGKKLLDMFTKNIRPDFPEAKLIFIGAGSSELPPEGVEFRENISEEEKTELLMSAWAYLSASSYEGFGIPYIEAMTCKTPVLTRFNCGAKEMFSDERWSLCRSQSEMASKISDLINEPGLREKLSKKAEKISENYSIELMGEKFEEVYKKLLKEKRC